MRKDEKVKEKEEALNKEALGKEAPYEEALSIEEMFARLDGLLECLEGDELTMEESFDVYAKGLFLVKKCRESIDEVEKKVLVLEESGEFREL